MRPLLGGDPFQNFMLNENVNDSASAAHNNGQYGVDHLVVETRKATLSAEEADRLNELEQIVFADLKTYLRRRPQSVTDPDQIPWTQKWEDAADEFIRNHQA